MSFTSYAQNFEDVMLWRALKHVKKGFYIDIGANDPVEHSVTKAMYDLGWTGINCEPVSHWFDKLKKERPNDINIQVAIGAEDTELIFYEVVDTGLSTLNKKIAEEHAKKLGYEIKEYIVPVKTLTSICNENNIHNIHFLKIDVEGAEEFVLEGIDFKTIRPWIIVIEATKPMSQDVDFDKWENIIITQNYHFVYFDGLNRFYVADEHLQLDKAFITPPNVFDNFLLSSEKKLWEKAIYADKLRKESEDISFHKIEDINKKMNGYWEKSIKSEKKLVQSEEKLVQSEEKLVQSEEKLVQSEEKLVQSEEKLVQLRNHYNALRNSSSWKVTKPYRYIGDKYKWFKGNAKAWLTFSPSSRPRKAFKHLLISTKVYVQSHPEKKLFLLKVLKYFPNIKARVMKVGKTTHYREVINTPVNISTGLSPRAQKVYNTLQKMREEQKGNN